MFTDSPNKDILYNFLCFMQKFNFKVLLYHASKKFNLKHDFDHVTTLTFPIAKIWATYAHKKDMYSGQSVQYGNDLVIQNHGTGLKLFPLSEVLDNDYNVIFFDLDIGFTSDPIPYLWQGLAETPDFITSLEVVTCVAEANNPVSGVHYTPNSGTLMVRSTPAGKSLLDGWINKTVEGNWFNEQQAFIWPTGYGKQPSESCNKLPSGLISGTQNTFSSQPVDSIHNPIKYCFLNKYLFQTGMILFGCRNRTYYGNIIHAGIPADEVLGRKDNTTKDVFFPVNVHVNARTPKSSRTKKEVLLKDMNMWIYNSSNLGHLSAESATKKPVLQCNKLHLASSRWVTKLFKNVWHSSWFYGDKIT